MRRCRYRRYCKHGYVSYLLDLQKESREIAMFSADRLVGLVSELQRNYDQCCTQQDCRSESLFVDKLRLTDSLIFPIR